MDRQNTNKVPFPGNFSYDLIDSDENQNTEKVAAAAPSPATNSSIDNDNIMMEIIIPQDVNYLSVEPNLLTLSEQNQSISGTFDHVINVCIENQMENLQATTTSPEQDPLQIITIPTEEDPRTIEQESFGQSSESIRNTDNTLNNKDPSSCFDDVLDFLYSDTAVDIKPGISYKIEKLLPITSNVEQEQSQNQPEERNIKPDLSNIKQEFPSSSSTSVPSSSRPLRVRKQRERNNESTKTSVEQRSSSSTWENALKQKLFFMNEEEFQAFKVDQGFQKTGFQKDPQVDFGTPDLSSEKMPRFVKSIPTRMYKESTSLSLYKNLRSVRADKMGVQVTHLEQALSQPKIEPKINKQKKPQLELLEPNEMVITVDFYHPSPSASIIKKSEPICIKPPKLATTIEILGSQTLKDLQTKFLCENDLVYIKNTERTNYSRYLDSNYFAMIIDEETFQSGAIVINNTVYTGNVIPNYSNIMRKWDTKQSYFNRFSEPCKSDTLAKVLKNIDFQIGYPYLYIHNPNCEHLIVFRNVRYLHAYDPQIRNTYPRFTYAGGFSSIPCRVNESHVAQFVVKDCDRLPEYLTPFCRECCEKFCFTSDSRGADVPVGSFKLYPLVQVPSVLLNQCKM